MRSTCTGIRSDSNGGSYFDRIDLDFTPTQLVEGQRSLLTSVSWPVVDLMFVAVDAGYEPEFLDWHPAPDPRLIVCLYGESIQRTTDGEERQFGPGGMFVTVDFTGRGHHSGNRGSTGYLIVRLAADPPTLPYLM